MFNKCRNIIIPKMLFHQNSQNEIFDEKMIFFDLVRRNSRVQLNSTLVAMEEKKQESTFYSHRPTLIWTQTIHENSMHRHEYSTVYFIRRNRCRAFNQNIVTVSSS